MCKISYEGIEKWNDDSQRLKLNCDSYGDINQFQKGMG